jgi:hypothetical protein
MLQWSLRVQQLIHSRHTGRGNSGSCGNGGKSDSSGISYGSISSSSDALRELRCPAWIQEADIPLREVVFQLSSTDNGTTRTTSSSYSSCAKATTASATTASGSVDDVTLGVLEAALEERSQLRRSRGRNRVRSDKSASTTAVSNNSTTTSRATILNLPHYAEGPYFASNNATQLRTLIVEVSSSYCCSYVYVCLRISTQMTTTSYICPRLFAHLRIYFTQILQQDIRGIRVRSEDAVVIPGSKTSAASTTAPVPTISKLAAASHSDASEGSPLAPAPTAPSVFTFRVDGLEVGFVTHPDRIVVTSVRPCVRLIADVDEGDDAA